MCCVQGEFQFWKAYEQSVDHMLDEDRRTLVYVTSDCEPQPVLVFACNASNMCVCACVWGGDGVTGWGCLSCCLVAESFVGPLRSMHPSESLLAGQLEYMETTRRHFHSVMNEEEYNKMRERKERRLSFKVRQSSDT